MGKVITTIILLCLGMTEVSAEVCRGMKEFQTEIAGIADAPSFQNLFDQSDTLGKGSFGIVVSAEWPYDSHNRQKVAIKELNLRTGNFDSKIRLLEQEVSMMKLIEKFAREKQKISDAAVAGIPSDRALRDPSAWTESPAPVVKECLIDKVEKKAFVVMELLQGDLGVRCVTRSNPSDGAPTEACPANNWAKLSAPDHLRLFHGIATNLQTVWDAGVVHEDIKPENIGVSDIPTMRTKLIDFGESQHKGHPVRGGTMKYMDLHKLQCFKGENKESEAHKADPASDVYALGISMLELLNARAFAKGLANNGNIFQVWNWPPQKMKSATAQMIWEKGIRIATNLDTLKNAGMFECVPVDSAGAEPESLCLFQLYFGLLHPDRNQRMTLDTFKEKIKIFMQNYNEVKSLNNEEIAKIMENARKEMGINGLEISNEDEETRNIRIDEGVKFVIKDNKHANPIPPTDLAAFENENTGEITADRIKNIPALAQRISGKFLL